MISIPSAAAARATREPKFPGANSRLPPLHSPPHSQSEIPRRDASTALHAATDDGPAAAGLARSRSHRAPLSRPASVGLPGFPNTAPTTEHTAPVHPVGDAASGRLRGGVKPPGLQPPGLRPSGFRRSRPMPPRPQGSPRWGSPPLGSRLTHSQHQSPRSAPDRPAFDCKGCDRSASGLAAHSFEPASPAGAPLWPSACPAPASLARASFTIPWLTAFAST